jgi:hypothetical protein
MATLPVRNAASVHFDSDHEQADHYQEIPAILKTVSGLPLTELSSVQRWSQLSNQSLHHPDLLKDAMKYMMVIMSVRSKALNAFVEDFVEDPSSALPHLQMFLTGPVKSIETALPVKRVEQSDSIIKTLKEMTEQGAVVVSGQQNLGDDEDQSHQSLDKDVLIGSKAFFCKAIMCMEFDEEVRSILPDIQELPTLHYSSSTLYEALRVMCVSHVEIIGLVDDNGCIISLISFADINAAFYKEVCKIYDKEGDENMPGLDLPELTNDTASETQDDDLNGFQARTAAEAKGLKDVIKGRRYLPRWRKTAQEWVESSATEFLIMFLLCMDLALTIWDALIPGRSNMLASHAALFDLSSLGSAEAASKHQDVCYSTQQR